MATKTKAKSKAPAKAKAKTAAKAKPKSTAKAKPAAKAKPRAVVKAKAKPAAKAPAKKTVKKAKAPARAASKSKAAAKAPAKAKAATKAAAAKKAVAKKPAKTAAKKPAKAVAKPVAKAPVKSATKKPPSAKADKSSAPPAKTSPVKKVVSVKEESKPAAKVEAPKAAEPKKVKAAPAKPVKLDFATDDYVVYPTHGVGKITGIEEQEISGMKLNLFIVDFAQDKMTLRVPIGKAKTSGMRRLSTIREMEVALTTLKGRARVKRTMWSRRAQEYEAKINSGDPVAIAEVLRDLHRNSNQPDQSYSERQIYEAALERLARELAVVEEIDEDSATERLEEVLKAA
jgi:CarD family transcriptional regulator